MSCNCNKVIDRDTIEEITIDALVAENPELWTTVSYNGATYLHYIPSPTGALRQYGLRNYGLGKKNIQLKVLKVELPSLLFTEITPIIEPNNSVRSVEPVVDFTNNTNPIVETTDELFDDVLEQTTNNDIEEVKDTKSDKKTKSSKTYRKKK